MTFLKLLGAAAIVGLLGTPVVHAHLSVSGDRTLNNGAAIDGLLVTNVTRTVSSSFGWADATDDNWGDSHRLTAFKFTLATTQAVTITVERRAAGSGAVDTLLPAFSLFQTPGWVASTHDTGPATTAWLTSTFGTTAVGETFVDANSNGIWDVGETFADANGNGVYDGPGIGGSGKKGAFRALAPWEIYQDSVGGARMAFDTYLGNAADGSAANFGSAAGINGDGVADGVVSRTFEGLSAGDYYVFVGGANYLAQLTESASPSYPTYGISLTVQAVPEPSSWLLLGLGSGFVLFVSLRRRQRPR